MHLMYEQAPGHSEEHHLREGPCHVTVCAAYDETHHLDELIRPRWPLERPVATRGADASLELSPSDPQCNAEGRPSRLDTHQHHGPWLLKGVLGGVRGVLQADAENFVGCTPAQQNPNVVIIIATNRVSCLPYISQLRAESSRAGRTAFREDRDQRAEEEQAADGEPYGRGLGACHPAASRRRRSASSC